MHIYIINIKFILAVEDLNNTSFSNRNLSVHNELSDDININKDHQQQQRINKKDRTGAAIKAEQAAKESLLKMHTLLKIAIYPTNSEMCEVIDVEVIPFPYLYFILVENLYGDYNGKSICKGSPSNDSTVFTMAVVELILDPCSGTVDLNEKIVAPKMLIYLNYIDEEQESDSRIPCTLFIIIY
ncbi:hypothetical protein C1646_765796 [Rhizophagus diaphanus]|nr:hypothetical protein C1646_765796 [Rhizophagus diaphanus] [Rhizophagus sp. MUCL 43196]